MGWWGCGVMEGDPPLDCLCEIEAQVLGEAVFSHEVESDEEYDDLFAKVDKALLNPSAVKKMAKEADESYEPDIYMQVLGLQVMRVGGPLSVIKDQVLEAVVNDGWAMEDVERQGYMSAFKNAIEAYVDGTPIDMSNQSKGLFQTFFEAIAEGKEGLINK